MRFIISFTIFSILTDTCWTEGAEKEIQGDVPSKDVLKLDKKNPEPEYIDMSSPLLNAMWSNKPYSQVPHVHIIDFPRRVFRQPYSMTKLAKSLTANFDPYFKKDDFEPFERRPKPITLVTFRNRNFLTRQPIQSVGGTSSERAELQSPFNEVSNFWSNSPYD